MILAAKTILTGDGSTVLKDSGVLLGKNGRIRAIDSLTALKAKYPEEPLTDYGESTILPGLIDMHVHVGYWWSKPDDYNYDDFLIAYMSLYKMQQAQAAGVTTLRDVASPKFLCRKMNLAATNGYIKIPRIFYCNRAICATGGHCWTLTGASLEADGEVAIRRAIREELRDGANWIKIMSSDRQEVSEYTQEELDSAVHECHRRKVRAAIHAGTQPSIQMAINAGFDTIEHSTYMTVEQAKQMKEKGLFWVPTIIAYTYIYEIALEMRRSGRSPVNETEYSLIERDFAYFESAANAYRENFKKLYDTGVSVCAGTDMVLDGAPPAPVAKELEYMVAYGITPVQAVATATSNCARALDMDGEIGILTDGAIADILVTSGDVSSDIRALSNVKAVFQSGERVV